jgi:modification methylase
MKLDEVIQGNCIEIINGLPEKSVDVVFADPPYNLQLQGELYRPNRTKVDPVDDAWDQFENFAAYDEFTRLWLSACRRVLKDTGTLWVIGSYHNIYRVGAILMDLGYWILNEIVWEKSNPTPQFKGARFTNAHETLIWAQKIKDEQYTFHYHALKTGNDDLQMRSVWELPICSGKERMVVNGEKAHTTQKPESLLHRVIVSSTNPGDVILDPFFGTGTTGAVAKKLRRHWIGIEREPKYIEVAHERIEAIQPTADNDETYYLPSNKPKPPRVPFIHLIESELLQPGQTLRLGTTNHFAAVTADGALIYNGQRGSIHKIATLLYGGPANGWTSWHYHDGKDWQLIDVLRQKLR